MNDGLDTLFGSKGDAVDYNLTNFGNDLTSLIHKAESFIPPTERSKINFQALQGALATANKHSRVLYKFFDLSSERGQRELEAIHADPALMVIMSEFKWDGGSPKYMCAIQVPNNLYSRYRPEMGPHPHEAPLKVRKLTWWQKVLRFCGLLPVYETYSLP